MEFSLSQEQELFRESADRFITKRYDFGIRQQIVASDEGFSRDDWAQFAEFGWLSAPFPEAYGGLGGTPIEIMILMEAFGRKLVPSPFWGTVVLGGRTLMRGGTEQHKSSLLPELMAGRLLISLALVEPGSRYNLTDVSTLAVRDANGFRLSGVKSIALYAHCADKLLVSARTSGSRLDKDGVSLFLVDAGADGITAWHYVTIDGQRASELTFKNVWVGPDSLIGDLDGASSIIDEVCDHGIAALCAEAVGAMSALYEATLEHLKTREQFGQAIGRFQAIQHRMVDVFMSCELSRSMTYAATLKLDTSDTRDRMRASSAAKVQIGKAGRTVGQEAIQLHGGMGMTDALPVGHHFKRLTAINTTLGDVAHHVERFRRLQ